MTTETINAEMATGIQGAGNYLDVALEMGFPYLEVYDWTSSAGDWTFLVSKDRKEWFVMGRENNWPSPGFTYYLNPKESWGGTAEEAMNQIAAFYC